MKELSTHKREAKTFLEQAFGFLNLGLVASDFPLFQLFGGVVKHALLPPLSRPPLQHEIAQEWRMGIMKGSTEMKDCLEYGDD